MQNERRRNRSENYAQAIRYQLAASVKRVKGGSMVLAGDDGLLIAGTGESAQDTELAAIAARMSVADPFWSGTHRTTVGSQHLSLAPVNTPAGRWVLCSTLGNQKTVLPELKHTSNGVSRIMSAHFPTG